MSNLTSWRKRLSLTVAQTPEGHLHIWRKTCPEGRPWATPRLPKASSLLSVSPLLLPKLSESAGRLGSWAVLPAAPLWLKGQLGPSTFSSGACVGIILSKSCLAGDRRSCIILLPWPPFPRSPSAVRTHTCFLTARRELKCAKGTG